MVKSQSQSGWGSGGVSCKVTVQSESVLSPTAKKATPPPYSVGGGVDNDSLCTTASTLSIQGDFCKICHCGADPAQVSPTSAIFFFSFCTCSGFPKKGNNQYFETLVSGAKISTVPRGICLGGQNKRQTLLCNSNFKWALIALSTESKDTNQNSL